MQRPTSLTIIGWLLIVFGALGLISQLMLPSDTMAQQMLAESPMPLSVHMAVGIIAGLVSIASGYGILKGLNWSRYLYVAWGVIAIVFALLTSPFTYILIISVAILAVVAFFLFREPANAWFTRGAAPLSE